MNDKSTSYFVTLYVLLFFVSIVIVATIYDYQLITKENEMIFQNCPKIFIDSYFKQCSESSSYSASSSNGIFAITPGQSAESGINLSKVDSSFLPKILLCFSAIKNSKKLFDTTDREDSISCLHGIKFICMLWIIIGHSYSFGMQWLFFSNPNQIKQAWQDLFSQIFANGTFSVDVFFFIR